MFENHWCDNRFFKIEGKIAVVKERLIRSIVI